ncbi:MAG: hypothetical protein QXG00_02030 [Candidatus Woesearchaeota archaeon]
MATLLDISIFKHFGSFFAFLLVWIILFAVLEKTHILGKERRGLNSLLALVISFLVLATSSVLNLVSFIVPWFIVLIIVGLLIIFTIRVFGADEESIVKAVKTDVYPYVIVIAIVILLFGLGSAFGQAALNLGWSSGKGSGNIGQNGNYSIDCQYGECPETNTNSFSNNLFNTIFHPKVVGMIFIMLVGVFLLVFLTKKDL